MNKEILESIVRGSTIESADFPVDEFGVSLEVEQFVKLVVAKCVVVANQCAIGRNNKEMSDFEAGYQKGVQRVVDHILSKFGV